MEHVEPQMCRPDSSVLMSIVLLTIGVYMKYVVSTQMLENYGAHSENGKFKDGNALEVQKAEPITSSPALIANKHVAFV